MYNAFIGFLPSQITGTGYGSRKLNVLFFGLIKLASL